MSAAYEQALRDAYGTPEEWERERHGTAEQAERAAYGVPSQWRETRRAHMRWKRYVPAWLKRERRA